MKWKHRLFSVIFLMGCGMLAVGGVDVAQAAQAAQPLFDEKNEQQLSQNNILLSATEGLELDQTKQTIQASGNATAIYKGMTIIADKITGFYIPKEKGAATSSAKTQGKNNFQIQRVEAIGHVKITSLKGETIYTNQAIFVLTSKQLTLKGTPSTLSQSDTTLSTNEPITYDMVAQKAVVVKGKIVNSNRTMTAPVMTAYFMEDPKDKNKTVLKKVETAGTTKIETPEESLTGDQSVYTAQTGLAVLTGHVVLKKGIQTEIHAGELTYDLSTGKAVLLPAPAQKKIQIILNPEDMNKASPL